MTRFGIIAFSLVACLLSFAGQAAAQKEADQKQASLTNTLWIQYAPSTLMEPEVPLTATLLYKKSRWLGFALDAGFFVAFRNYRDNLIPYSGYRFKPEIKFYIENLPTGPHGLYFSVQGIIKRTYRNNEEWMNQTDSSGQVLFTRLVNYKERKTVFGLNLIFGGELILGKSKRWLIDIYCGLGVRNKAFKALNLPPGFEKVYFDNSAKEVFSIYRRGSYFSIPAGLKLGYRLR